MNTALVGNPRDSGPRRAGRQPRCLYPGRERHSRAEPARRAAARASLARRAGSRCRARAGAVAPAFRRAHRPRLHGLRAAARRPHPGRQRRPHEGREALRPRRRRAPGLLRRPLDPRRDPRIRAAQLAPRPRRDDEGPAQAVLQPAARQDRTSAGCRARRPRPSREDLGVPAREVTEMEQRLAGQDVVFDPMPSADDEGRRFPGALPAGSGCRSRRWRWRPTTGRTGPPTACRPRC